MKKIDATRYNEKYSLSIHSGNYNIGRNQHRTCSFNSIGHSANVLTSATIAKKRSASLIIKKLVEIYW